MYVGQDQLSRNINVLYLPRFPKTTLPPLSKAGASNAWNVFKHTAIRLKNFEKITFEHSFMNLCYLKVQVELNAFSSHKEWNMFCFVFVSELSKKVFFS